MLDSMWDSVAVATSVGPQPLTTGTKLGAAVDMGGKRFRVAMLVVTSGIIANGTHDWSIEVSDNSTVWGPAPAGDVQGSIPQITTTADENVARMGYVGSARYIRAKCVSASALAGGPMAAVFLLRGGSGDVIT